MMLGTLGSACSNDCETAALRVQDKLDQCGFAMPDSEEATETCCTQAQGDQAMCFADCITSASCEVLVGNDLNGADDYIQCIHDCSREESSARDACVPPPADPTSTTSTGGTGGTGGEGGSGAAGGSGGQGGSGGNIPPVTPGTYDTVEGPEAPSILDYLDFQIVIADQQNVFEDDLYVAIAGTGGQQLHRLSDGSVAFDFTGAMGGPSYGIMGANNVLITIGPEGYAQRAYNEDTQQFGFAQLGAIGQNVTGLTPVPLPTGGVRFLLANNQLNQGIVLNPLSGGGFQEAGTFPPAPSVAAAGLTNFPIVHTYSPPDIGPLLGIGDSPSAGLPGRLWRYDPASQFLEVVGNVGEGPRRVDCLDPQGTPCAVSNYVSGEITLVDWPNRSAAPTIGATTVPVAGPVGIDVAMVMGTPTVAATGFSDDTLHLITIGPNLTPDDTTIGLTGCTQPGHVVFTPDAEHLVVTCNGSDNFQVLEVPSGL